MAMLHTELGVELPKMPTVDLIIIIELKTVARTLIIAKVEALEGRALKVSKAMNLGTNLRTMATIIISILKMAQDSLTKLALSTRMPRVVTSNAHMEVMPTRAKPSNSKAAFHC